MVGSLGDVVQEERKLDCRQDRLRVSVLHPGEIFGEMAIFDKEVRSATVRALGEARVLTIDKKTFLRRMEEDPSVAFNVAHALCGRVRRLDAEIVALQHEVSKAQGGAVSPRAEDAPEMPVRR